MDELRGMSQDPRTPLAPPFLKTESTPPQSPLAGFQQAASAYVTTYLELHGALGLPREQVTALRKDTE